MTWASAPSIRVDALGNKTVLKIRRRNSWQVSRCGPIDEGCVLLDSGGQLSPLKVEHSTLGSPKADGSPKEGLVNGVFGELW
ncbi:hypothetical protein CRG98_029949 [Punica granatum]|uniref:Uncharacterized protein n=1 Tax=Punica granatum TaxID=22663 RepID=A0A2I0J0E6_PUNGR|nr:hypothetical protein CRG98_029949 [Punica granatum]